MIAIVQRVLSASVVADDKESGVIDRGLAVLVGIHQSDTDADIEWMAGRLVGLRIFADAQGKMNLSVIQAFGERGAILLVPNFTLCAQTGKGHRPSFIEAMEPGRASSMFDELKRRIGVAGPRVAAGVFGADMRVTLVNDGPVTIVLDSSRSIARSARPTT
jgi:D-aminoacyl-tRNA deacylase